MKIIAEMIAWFTEEDAAKDLYGIFDIGVDEEMLGGEPSPWAVVPPGLEERVTVGPNAVMLERSGEASSYVRYELWDGEPSDDHSWEHAWLDEVYLSTGRISAMSMVPGDTHHHTVFDLGRRATTWRLRVQWRFLDNDHEPLFPRDIYQVDLFNLQLWPPPS
jgi:hypothetical protein